MTLMIYTGCSGVPSSASRRGSVADLERPAPGPGVGPAWPAPVLLCLAGLRVRRASVLTTAYSISDVKTNRRHTIIQMSIACVHHDNSRHMPLPHCEPRVTNSSSTTAAETAYLRHQQQVVLLPFDLESGVRVTCDVGYT